MAILLKSRSRKRAWYLLAFVGMIALGLASRRYPHVLPAAMGKYPGDVMGSLMVFCGMAVIFSMASSLELGCRALSFAFVIEALKLCQSPWLAGLRHSTLGHLVFGHVFSWQNLVAYTRGVLVGVFVEALVVPNLSASGVPHKPW